MFRLNGLTHSPHPTPPPDPYTALPRPRHRHANRARRMSVPSPAVVDHEELDQTASESQCSLVPGDHGADGRYEDVGMRRGISKTRGRYVSMPDMNQFMPLHQDHPGVSAPVDRRHPRVILSSLEELLGGPEHIMDVLEIDDLEAHYERDLMECQQRAAARQSMGSVAGEWQANYGISLREVWMCPHQSVSTLVGGVYECELPAVVFECVEELFRRKCNRFPENAVFAKTGAAISPADMLRTSSTADVWSILLTYLSSLPSPLLSPSLSEAVRQWCIDPWEAEETRVCISRLILNLLPTPNFSLFIYMTAFLHWTNRGGYGIPEMMIRILEGVYGKGSARGSGETITEWFLARWSWVAEDLPQSRSSESRARWVRSGDLPGDFFGCSPAMVNTQSQYLMKPRIGVGLDAWSRKAGEEGTDTGKLQENLDHTIPNILLRSPSPGQGDIVVQDEDFRIQYQKKDLDVDSVSLYSTSALEERLLDLSIPPCMDESFTIQSYDDQPLEVGRDIQTSDCSSLSSVSTRSSSFEGGGLTAAHRRIRQLEHELEKNDSVLQDALEETFRTRERMEELEKRQAVLEDECERLKQIL